jgi:hypothetical protein
MSEASWKRVAVSVDTPAATQLPVSSTQFPVPAAPGRRGWAVLLLYCRRRGASAGRAEQEEKMANVGYVQLRRGILEHLQDGRMTSDEFAAFTVMLLKADHKTGVWRGAGKALARLLG